MSDSNQRSRKTRRQSFVAARNCNLEYGNLESRQLLASMLYVDFGFSTGDLKVTNKLVQPLNGPEVFEGDFELESFQTAIAKQDQASLRIDWNEDGEYNRLDATDMARQVIRNLREVFKPFDVDVKWVNSADFDGMRSQLDANEGNDAYIFVGGNSPLEKFDSGAANVDKANLQDNLGFVFSSDILDEFSPHLCFDFCPGQGLPASWALARSIAKQAGHTFGLESTNAGKMVSANDVMAMSPGKDFDGAPVDVINRYTPAFFARTELPVVNDGKSADWQNSFELLSQNMGLRANQPYFYTGNGESNHIIVSQTTDGVVIKNGDEVTVLVGDEIANGLLIDTGVPVTAEFSDRVSIRPDVQVPIEVRNAETLELLDSLFLGQQQQTNQWDVHRGVEDIIGGELYDIFGTLNDNISFEKVGQLEGNSHNDVFRFNAADHLFGSRSDWSSFLPPVDAFGKGGNDLFIVNNFGGSAAIGTLDGGSENDRFLLEQGSSVREIIGGDGFDIIDMTRLEQEVDLSVRDTIEGGQFEMMFQLTDGIPQFFALYVLTRTDLSGFERVYTDGDQVGTISSNYENENAGHKLDWIIDGNKTTILDRAGEARVEIFGDPDRLESGKHSEDWFFVKQTVGDLEFVNPDMTQLSSEFNPRAGNLDGIQHAIHFWGDPEATMFKPCLTLGGGGGVGLTGTIMHDQIDGLTTQSITLEGFAPCLTVHGSLTEADDFTVSSTPAATRIYGHGGDDQFTIGQTDSRESAQFSKPSLDTFKGKVKIDAGDGSDSVTVDHQQGTGMNFDVANSIITTADSNNLNTSFRGLMYFGVEDMHLTLAHYLDNNVMNINGSDETTYEIMIMTSRVNGSEKPKTDDLVLVGGDPADRTFVPDPNASSSDIANGTAPGTWVFSNEHNPITILRSDSTFDL